ncbi:hypothetical protein pdam_00013479 [Pocillopora damicornis]|uniref:Uncharacterized protein n=1 Tax=Pocillopora damicornis TaxID=46731 RepID=A0A3M6TJ21_POCDA|nr:hypothetical protein pdam_00013479 [Pocillopora damicornis]
MDLASPWCDVGDETRRLHSGGMHKNALFKGRSTLVAMVTTAACSRPRASFSYKNCIFRGLRIAHIPMKEGAALGIWMICPRFEMSARRAKMNRFTPKSPELDEQAMEWFSRQRDQIFHL